MPLTSTIDLRVAAKFLALQMPSNYPYPTVSIFLLSRRDLQFVFKPFDVRSYILRKASAPARVLLGTKVLILGNMVDLAKSLRRGVSLVVLIVKRQQRSDARGARVNEYFDGFISFSH